MFHVKHCIYNTIIIYINIIILYDTSYNKSGYYINIHFQAYFSQKIHYVSRETLGEIYILYLIKLLNKIYLILKSYNVKIVLCI